MAEIMDIKPDSTGIISKSGWVVVYDTEDGTQAWGWYDTYEEAGKAEAECRREMRIDSHGEDWVVILPCWANIQFGYALKEKGVIR